MKCQKLGTTVKPAPRPRNNISIPGSLYILHCGLRIQLDNICNVLRIFSRRLEIELRIGIRAEV